ncbi:hypothetical protein LSH36_252g02027 [Paralvinella palmiformis]|uniref:C-type lectin domain-containing protein n=1 Tax=Paralvinella palmiformis TaxID=53620 RepID=A0AAD9JLH9_9ANNE|nr:hypothetical protein LSH36_252g02027 [Paralvinella palmiformis]
MSYLHVMVLTTLMIGINSSKINQCLNSAITYLKGTASYLPHSGFTLYKLDDSVTWCEAYHYCSQVGQRMASIKNPDIQESLGFAMHTANVRELIWLGARRKDFGNDWTWINKSLTDCKIQLTSTGHPSANMMAVNNSIKITNDEELSDPCCLINGTKLDIRNTTVTWFQAQNICQQAGGWLTTNEEPPKDKAAAKCWIGLYRNPWIWIDGTATPNYEPVLFSAWADSSDLDRQCMIIDTNKSIGWTSVQCTERYHYVLCQDNSKSKKSTVGWGVGVFLAILSVGSVTFSLFLYLKSRNSDALPTFLIERSATSGESVAYRPKDAQKNRIIKSNRTAGFLFRAEPLGSTRRQPTRCHSLRSAQEVGRLYLVLPAVVRLLLALPEAYQRIPRISPSVEESLMVPTGDSPVFLVVGRCDD